MFLRDSPPLGVNVLLSRVLSVPEVAVAAVFRVLMLSEREREREREALPVTSQLA